ncbi:SDR family NAD(P)-dependent oxidoreductase [Candidatus Berkiella aquae]|uniref:C-factor n=1 Tax=Candidatus Berkiella aquae TaxID=295108 RepID=A0A0Q9YY64_9GAMM|nr:SDR family oxidoreductase [Candidatus Berkiella aquae]MCS5711546.1 SDR family oxidoreductase [Candidatus Berkiella aquae]
MDTILITGANRGLGLEFVRQYAENGANVLACCRDLAEASELQALKEQYNNIKLFALDVSNTEQIQSLANELKEPIDILINNAGMLQKENLQDLSVDTLLQTFMVNSIAPIKMAAAFTPHLANSKRKCLVCISSSMGSISENLSGGYYSYRSSKAALNMLMKSAAIDLASQGIKVLLLHPGWVRTRMGGSEATTEAVESIQGMRKVIENYQPAAGEVIFYRYDGGTVKW